MLQNMPHRKLTLSKSLAVISLLVLGRYSYGINLPLDVENVYDVGTLVLIRLAFLICVFLKCTLYNKNKYCKKAVGELYLRCIYDPQR